MPATRPFVRFFKRTERAELDALLGFSLPFLPDVLTSRWLSCSSAHERLFQALKLQIRLISQRWGSGVAAWDLRFVGTESLPGVAIGLLGRLSLPSQFPPHRFPDYRQDRATFIQQLFADFGYELAPLTDEASLLRYLSPFRFQTLGEIRRYEELLALEDAYTHYEVYVPYPWLWSSQSRLRLFEAVLQRQGDCLVSVCLEPTQLGIHEQGHHTPAYASPEQLQGLALDYHSDIYSLGVVICELLAGQGLFPGLLQHLEAPPSITQKFGVPVSPAIEAVVAKALAKQPAQRYQCAGEMANAF